MRLLVVIAAMMLPALMEHALAKPYPPIHIERSTEL